MMSLSPQAKDSILSQTSIIAVLTMNPTQNAIPKNCRGQGASVVEVQQIPISGRVAAIPSNTPTARIDRVMEPTGGQQDAEQAEHRAGRADGRCVAAEHEARRRACGRTREVDRAETDRATQELRTEQLQRVNTAAAPPANAKVKSSAGASTD